MSWFSRIANVFRANRLSGEIDEEFRSHIAEAIEQGRDPAEARIAFGPVLRQREASRDVRIAVRLDSLRADTVFGWRQMKKSKVTSAAAVLSLALAIGACTSAFRLVDALLFRPLPVAAPDRLYALSRQIMFDGKLETFDGCEYPLFRQMRAAVSDYAELIAISYIDRVDLTYGSDQETEKASLQYVSGWMFHSFGVKPAAGRVFTEDDDRTPGAHPYAVLSHDYWARRFGQDPKAIGRTFRAGNDIYEIIGVSQEPFTGTEPGTMTDIFVPTMMVKNHAIERSDYQWIRTFIQLKPGAAVAPVEARLRTVYRVFQQGRVKELSGMPKRETDAYLGQKLMVIPAASGVSGMQKDYGRSLSVLGVLVGLVLLIACANVANLMTARAASRAREMALRVSIGAGRFRLVQMVLVECALLAFLAAAIGGLFAWWAAPFVVGAISLPGNPTRLALPADWRVLGFGFAIALGVTLLLGLPPALRASAVKPATALKGGDDLHSRRRLMHVLIAAQVAFCFLVLFVAGMFVTTFNRLSNQPTGFSSDRLLILETLTASPQRAEFWEQVADRLRAVPGVEKIALCEWPLMTGESWNGFISANGGTPDSVPSYFLTVSPGWMDTMRIPLIAGRDFYAHETERVVIVNRKFARQYFGIENPVGKTFDVVSVEGPRFRYRIVGLTGDVRYRNMREPMQPLAYFPFEREYSRGNFIVRASDSNPLALSSVMRQEVQRARPGFRVSNIRTEEELVLAKTVRERLLAMLAMFFAAVALLLAGVGLYGVLDYSVLQRRREIGIRMAVGAQAGDIALRVTTDVFSMVVVGALLGLALGMTSARYIESLFYQVKATDAAALAEPSLAILAAAFLAALPAVIHAVRIDPAAMLRAD